MMTDDELDRYFARLGIPEAGREYIRRCRKAPSRLVRSNGKNVRAREISDKMNHTIQAESRTVELPVLQMLEDNLRVKEYHDQAGEIILRYKHATIDRMIGTTTHPDILVLWDTFVELLELKEEAELLEMERHNPNRVYKDSSGKWRCPSAEEYCQRLGIRFRVVSSSEINWTLYSNMEFLRDYIRYSIEDLVSHAEKIMLFVEENPGIVLKELTSNFCSDHVFALITKQYIFVDLYDERLSNPERVKVYNSKQTCEAYKICRQAERISLPIALEIASGSLFTWDGIIYKVINMGKTRIVLQRINSSDVIEIENEQFYELFSQGRFSGITQPEKQDEMIFDVLKKAKDSELQEALKRYRIIRPFLDGEEKNKQEAQASERTLYRWLAAFQAAQAAFGSGFFGLIPRFHNRGFRGEKRTGDAVTWMQEAIVGNKTGLPSTMVYSSYSKKCDEHEVQPVSTKTFYSHVRARGKYKLMWSSKNGHMKPQESSNLFKLARRTVA
jgi:putative transposase